MDLIKWDTNVDRPASRESMTAQGDFPEEVRTIPARPRYIAPSEDLSGSLENGVAFEQDIYDSATQK